MTPRKEKTNIYYHIALGQNPKNNVAGLKPFMPFRVDMLLPCETLWFKFETN